jgi:hypothetical protein
MLEQKFSAVNLNDDETTVKSENYILLGLGKCEDNDDRILDFMSG